MPVLVIAGHGDDLDMIRQTGHMVGSREDAPGENLTAFMPGRDNGFLGRFSKRRDIVVLVDDGIADHQHLHVPDPVHQPLQLAHQIRRAHLVQKRSQFRIARPHIAVDQVGRGKDHIIGKGDPPAVALHREPLARDVAGHILRLIGVFRPLYIDIGLKGFDDAERGRFIGNGHPVDAAEGRQHFCAHRLGKHGPPWSLVHKLIGRQGDHQARAQARRRLKMADMAKMQEIKGAVGQGDDFSCALAQSSQDLGQFSQAEYLLAHWRGHWNLHGI